MPTRTDEAALWIKRLTYAKYLLLSASHSLRSSSPLVAGEGLLRLHDSIEIFQSVILDRIGVPKQKYGAFMEFWEEVKKVKGQEPPYKDRFRALNELRNSFKHQALLPNVEELRGLAAVVPLFFQEVCRNELAFEFVEIGLGDLMPEGDLRRRVKAAERLVEAGDRDGAVTELAIAMECVFETVFPDTSWDDPWSSLFQGQKVSYDEMLLRSGELGPKAVRAINNSLDEMGTQVQELRQVVSLVALGVDLRNYIRFRRIRRRETTLTDDDVDFCLQFVTDTALNIEARSPVPPGVRSA